MHVDEGIVVNAIAPIVSELDRLSRPHHAAERVERLDWPAIADELDHEGNVVLTGLLTAHECNALIAGYDDPSSIAKRLLPGSANLGASERIHLGATLPEPLASLRAALYARVAPIANRWHQALAIDMRYPERFDLFVAQCVKAGAARPCCSMSRYRTGDFETLHHHASDTAPAFPLQLVLLLSEPKRDFNGGEFVMTEQRPRMQSRPIVLPLKRGDAALIAVHHRPFQGGRGTYRVSLRHAVSRIRDGERHAIEMLFDDVR
jgi:hypothetical protein